MNRIFKLNEAIVGIMASTSKADFYYQYDDRSQIEMVFFHLKLIVLLWLGLVTEYHRPNELLVFVDDEKSNNFIRYINTLNWSKSYFRVVDLPRGKAEMITVCWHEGVIGIVKVEVIIPV